MRIRISHRTTYEYEAPPRVVTQVLRLTPRNHEGQRVSSWRIDIDVDCALRASEDSFGNFTHSFSAAGPLNRLTVTVEGEVETFDCAGVVRGTSERFPPELFLRPTPLTTANQAMRKLAVEIAAQEPEELGRLHALMGHIHTHMAFDVSATSSGTTAAQAFALGRGVCQDYAHIFISCARLMDVPARYVSGYFVHLDGPVEQEAGHGWAEAFIPDLGWVGFDPLNDICPIESHVCVARGVDYLSAAPVRGARTGGDGEAMTVKLQISKI